MPILNLSKSKKGEEDTKTDVPDELPSLPSEEKQEEKKEEPKEETQEPVSEEKKEETPSEPATEEKKEEAESSTETQEEPSLAPDELPPVEEEPQQQPEEQKEQVHSSTQSKVLDEKLYFSKLIKKFNEGVPIDEIENEIMSKDVISSLQENIDYNAKQDDKSLIEQTIKEKISTLQQLERDWAVLKRDIEQKQGKFAETEQKIREHTEDIKNKFREIDELKKQF